jgi:hypothetical protein
VIVAPPRRPAKHAEYLHYASAEAGVAHFAAPPASTSRLRLDEPIGTPGQRHPVRHPPPARQRLDPPRLLEQHALGGRYVTLVGSPNRWPSS